MRVLPYSPDFFSALRSRRTLQHVPSSQPDKTASDLQDQADEIVLADMFKRQDRLKDRFSAIAEMVYITRCDWIGNMCLPWGMLTDGQRQGYINEVRNLITKAKGE